MMIYPSVDKILTVISSKYELVHIVADRSENMKATGRYQMKKEEFVSKKDLGKALEEVAEGLITVVRKK